MPNRPVARCTDCGLRQYTGCRACGALLPAPVSTVIQSLPMKKQAIARLVATGMSNKEIAAQLGLAEQSVKNYLSRVIYPRLGVHRRLQLALAVKKGER